MVMQEIIDALNKNLNDSQLFTIRGDGDTIVIDFDLLNQEFWLLLTKHSVKYLHTVYVKVNETSRSAKVWNEWREVVWEAGVPRLGAIESISFSKGTTYNLVKEAEYKTSKKGIEQAYDVSINTYNILDQVKNIIAATGYRLRMDTYTKIGLIVGIGSLVATLLGFFIVGLVMLLG